MNFLFNRIYRERLTIEKMIRLFCKDNHNSAVILCDECQNLLEYALQRIDYCPFSVDKPVCNKCPIHCYKKDMREKVRIVMRYSGPRMIRHHPLLAILHIFDKFKEPAKIGKKIKVPTTN